MSAPTPDAIGAAEQVSLGGPEQIAKLRRLLDAATPAPWSFYSDDLWAGVTADELQRADAIYASGVAFSDDAEDILVTIPSLDKLPARPARRSGHRSHS